MDFELLKMTAEEATEQFMKLIAYMKTDEYWLEHGGDCPKNHEGAQLLLTHCRLTEDKGIEANKTLQREYIATIFANMSKPYIINRTTTNTVKAIMMSGVEDEVSLENVETLNHLTTSVVKTMMPKRVKAV